LNPDQWHHDLPGNGPPSWCLYSLFSYSCSSPSRLQRNRRHDSKALILCFL
jgi:hypothetical protein